MNLLKIIRFILRFMYQEKKIAFTIGGIIFLCVFLIIYYETVKNIVEKNKIVKNAPVVINNINLFSRSHQLFIKKSIFVTPSHLTTTQTLSQKESYELDIKIKFSQPTPATNINDIIENSPEILDILPNLNVLLQSATVLPEFEQLFSYKVNALKSAINLFRRLPDRDNLFDCQTMLSIHNNQTGRKAVLIQSIMNVDTDGSDGDRDTNVNTNDPNFQMQTDYKWPKVTSKPNPYIKKLENQLLIEEQKLNDLSDGKEEEHQIQKNIANVRSEITELQKFSFLIGTSDPFIVLPSFMIKKSTQKISVGDYAIVIVHGILYPAILGDLGPASKIGEASFRLCKAINSAASGTNRCISTPEVIYLIFPETANKPWSAPNYEHWSKCCHQFWMELGGKIAVHWYNWNENTSNPNNCNQNTNNIKTH